MGKRSNFERIPRDFYPTPFAAVPPLIPYLRGVRSFAEPCAGDGDLIRHLESFRLRCVHSGDIATGQDALDLAPADITGAPIITNPPFSRESRPLLRRLIAHFPRIAPMAWLLLPRISPRTSGSRPSCPSAPTRANRPRHLVRGHKG